jgi:hypothetical protein
MGPSALEENPLISNFQEHVISRLFGKQMVNYTATHDHIAYADYGDITVIRNGNYDQSYTIRGYTLPSFGVLVESDDGSLIAGIFSAFNGEELVVDEPGDHFIIQESESNVITFKHCFGPDTPVKINRPSEWTNASQIKVKGYTSEDTYDVAFNTDNKSIQFNVQEYINDEKVSEYKITYGITGISETENQNVSEINKIIQNHPNPFNTITTIVFQISARSNVSINIYNLQGQEIRNLVNNDFEAGIHKIEWNGLDNIGKSVPTGMYMIRMLSGGDVRIGKCLLLK